MIFANAKETGNRLLCHFGADSNTFLADFIGLDVHRTEYLGYE